MNINTSVTSLTAVFAVLTSAQFVFADSLVQVRLVDPLDEPEFYCLDLSGWGDHLKLEDPLQAHTCKLRGADDQMFIVRQDRILVGTTGRCLEIAGSGTPLPGAAILARECSDGPMQTLTLEENGQIAAKGSGLCLAVGDRSADASGPSHVWRVLTVEPCEVVSPELMTWQIGL
jgi:hypothetical protein